MLLETNYLTYKTGSGRWGDVDPRQNNFRRHRHDGRRRTGRQLPGRIERRAGADAASHRLLGEHVARPLAPRTREKQDDIIELSQALGRAVRFDDLTNRWAKDRNYAKSIEWVAERYRSANCTASGAPLHPADDDVDQRPRAPRVAVAAMAAPPPAANVAQSAQPVTPPRPSCDVYSASYGGSVTLLIRSVSGAAVNYTVLQVEPDLEQPQADAFIKAHAPNGKTIARFATPEPAFMRAFELCPDPS